MEKRHLTCIECPMGCQICVTLDGIEVVSVEGNNCIRGDRYSRKEVVSPTRTVTSTMVITNGSLSRISCKTESDIPKDKIFDVMNEINHVKVSAPKKIGDILIKNVAETGVSVVATRNVGFVA